MNGYWRRCYGGRVIHYFVYETGKTLCGKTLTARVWESAIGSRCLSRYPKCKKCEKLFEEAECTTTNSEP